MSRSFQETVFGIWPARFAIALAILCRGHLRLRQGSLYRAMEDLCWVERVSGIAMLRALARPAIFRTIDVLRTSRHNPVVESYLRDPQATADAASYSLAGGRGDFFRDLIVLKPWTPREKGVILLKYAKTFAALVSLFDLERLMERYLFVLEPCWSGFCHPSTLMFVSPNNPVVVQCFTKDDLAFITAVGAPLAPVQLGPADWVDASTFNPPDTVAKPIDLVMVANWSPHKRHAELFRALQRITDRDIRVLLIGFPWADRTADDIRREAAKYKNDRVQIEILEKVPQPQLVGYLSRCKVFVFLARKEGDNKALVEAMFANVPAIVYDKTIGGAGSRINAETGVFSSDAELTDKIRYMLDHYKDFSPRKWVLEHSGSSIATRVLNDALKGLTTQYGIRYAETLVEKTNAPNLAYKDPLVRARFQSDYDFVLGCRRGVSAPPLKAVV